MHEAETRALKRATLVLLVLSAVRWGWSERERPSPPAGASVLPELLAASRDVAEEESRRAEALGPDERVDPNRADEVELDRLPGVGPSTARAIVSAREGGAVFRVPEDLLAVPGIGAASLARIRDRLDLAHPPPGSRTAVHRGGSGAAPTRVDVNHADLETLQTLPGVGPALAERILVARREQLFTSLDDLVRVRGIGPATVERLRALATTGP